ncbi:hypothetical protein BN7_4034 [Wickerhamomyces ciferrii]|uniref:PPM-type phosphatase domain-containing protein n=1 Tax=Wickerhamomyces ciferrii (strain ATCC 14091 / BCRC 22168 / CBS 111 / JCM 3599 / NBRC 0793 / NRRL Y-1031 F-60-10) TaxID=1206466 RepID=K0KGZ7_WICCF|nr:uncharacterized protein BN7_4034 [Wickerhamomyces ciferrii]CCH44470.1 hypothetical protein BN7_4034 [Wickerhamomyces ciferrii]
MTRILVTRSNTLRSTKKLLTTTINNSLKSNSNRCFSSSSTSLIKLLNSTKNLNKKKGKSMKELNIALASGILFVASYISLSSHYLSDSGLPSSNGLKSFSTTQSNNNSNTSNKQNLYLLNDDEITKRLRNLEESYYVNRGKGVIRYDISQLPSNNPIEDDRSESVITVPITSEENADFYFWGIYDGHSGYYTSLKLRDDLINYVVNELGSIYKPQPENPQLRIIPTQESIDLAIKQGFLKLDYDIVQKSLTKLLENPNDKSNAINALPAASGACGLLTFYDSSSQILKVAVTGDSRALLGSLNEENEWTVTSLSNDQTGDSKEEIERIQSEHPNEPNVIKNGRVLGSLQPTRAFGDFRYKLKEIAGKSIDSLPEHLRIYFRQPPRNLLTPPYVTAEPEITSIKINPSKNDFLVIGSDGLYELLSNEEIVGLVVKWLEKNKINESSPSLNSKSWKFFTKDDKKLPQIKDLSNPIHKEAQRPAFRNKKTNESHEFLLEDSNVSTHLIRNALSLGGSKDYVSTLVSIPSPTSRKYRDDLTVTVVFFGQDGFIKEDGKLEINLDATKGGNLNEKPKL